MLGVGIIVMVFMQRDRGLGLSAHIIDHCNLILKFPQGTNSTWVMFKLVWFLF